MLIVTLPAVAAVPVLLGLLLLLLLLLQATAPKIIPATAATATIGRQRSP
jgi:hypothetical protein